MLSVHRVRLSHVSLFVVDVISLVKAKQNSLERIVAKRKAKFHWRGNVSGFGPLFASVMG